MRSDETDPLPVERPHRLLREAERNFLHAIAIFDALIAKIRTGKPVSDAESRKAAQAFHSATVTFFALRKAMEAQSHAEDTVRQPEGLDLEEARDRVGRLLDRLRSSEPSMDVS